MPEGLSDKESDYKSHILYVVPQEANSQKALRQLQQHRGVETDVWGECTSLRILWTPRPGWKTTKK